MRFTTRAARAEISKLVKERQAKELELFNNGFKHCKKCSKDLPIDMFWKHKGGRFCLEPSCKICKELSKNRSSTLIKEEYFKKCKTCGVEAKCEEDLDLFVKYNGRHLYGRRNICKKCHNAKIKLSDRNIKRRCKYKGISVDEYVIMFKEQDGKCKICGISEDKTSKSKLHIDHCHTTGAVRGLLCSNCNTALGLMKDDIYVLKNAISYLASGVQS